MIGAGRSSSTLIKYFLDNAGTEGWEIILGDMDLELARSKVNGNNYGKAIEFNAMNFPVGGFA